MEGRCIYDEYRKGKGIKWLTEETYREEFFYWMEFVLLISVNLLKIPILYLASNTPNATIGLKWSGQVTEKIKKQNSL